MPRFTGDGSKKKGKGGAPLEVHGHQGPPRQMLVSGRQMVGADLPKRGDVDEDPRDTDQGLATLRLRRGGIP